MDFTRISRQTISLMEVLGKTGGLYLRLLGNTDYYLFRRLVLDTLTRVSDRGMQRQPENGKTGNTTQ